MDFTQVIQVLLKRLLVCLLYFVSYVCCVRLWALDLFQSITEDFNRSQLP